MLGSEGPRGFKFSCTLLMLVGMVLSTGGCGSIARSPVIELVRGSADDLIRQGDSASAVSKKIAEAVENMRSSSAAAMDDAARARSAMQRDPIGDAALTTVCTITFDIVTGQLPDTAEEWFAYAGDLATQLDDGEALAADAREVVDIIVAWRRGEADAPQLQLAVIAFQQIYC